MDAETERLNAYHEAGHAIVATALGCSVESVSARRRLTKMVHEQKPLCHVLGARRRAGRRGASQGAQAAFGCLVDRRRLRGPGKRPQSCRLGRRSSRKGRSTSCSGAWSTPRDGSSTTLPRGRQSPSWRPRSPREELGGDQVREIWGRHPARGSGRKVCQRARRARHIPEVLSG